MAVAFLKTGSDACDSCAEFACGCCISTTFSETRTVDGYDVWNSYVYLQGKPMLCSLVLEFQIDPPDAGLFARVTVDADSVEIYDSGCINPGALVTLTPPQGTYELAITVEQECSGTWAEAGWSWELRCP
jgi:hypothetical protein